MTVADPIAHAIDAFLEPRVATRMRTLIASGTPRSHARLVGMLPHLDAFRVEHAHRPTGAERLADALRDAGDPQRFVVLSESPRLDGRTIDVADLLAEAHAGVGILAAAEDGSVAVWCGEGRDGAVVLR